jgi:hypothetical protein
MNLREAIAHELERLREDELELVLAFVSALASLDRQAETTELFRQMQELGKPADPATQRMMEALLRQAQELSEMADPVTRRAIVALWTARAIAKAHGITDEDVLEEIQAYRASTALSTSPSSTQRSQSLGLGQ